MLNIFAFSGNNTSRRVVLLVAGSQPPPPAAPPVDQHPRMAEAIVIGTKGATAAKKEKKEKFASASDM